MFIIFLVTFPASIKKNPFSETESLNSISIYLKKVEKYFHNIY